MNMEKWSGKIAIVTGASAGIGEAIVRDFVKFGITTVALARRLEKLETLKNELKGEKGEIIPVKCDVSDKASIDAAFDEIEKKVGIAHILVNNAGIAIHSSMLGDEENAEETITKTINTNFLGLVMVARKSYRLMKKADDYGMIINIGSVGGHANPYAEYFLNVYPGM
jgi:NADP+-dependent farnesol dehydrogenase